MAAIQGVLRAPSRHFTTIPRWYICQYLTHPQPGYTSAMAKDLTVRGIKAAKPREKLYRRRSIHLPD